MTKQYKHNAAVSFANRIAVFTMKIGIAPKYQFILSVRGRKSGRIYSTPVYIVEDNSRRLLVSPYGEVAWVINARAAGKVTLTKGTETKEYKIDELSSKESAPILKSIWLLRLLHNHILTQNLTHLWNCFLRKHHDILFLN